MDKKLEARIARLEKLVANESRNTKFEGNKVNFDELNLFFHPDLYQTLGFDRVYDIAKAATEYVTDQQGKVDWGDPEWIEKLKLASALNPSNNPIFDEFCKSMNINFNELDSRSAKLLSSGIRRTLGKYATMHLKANGGRLSRDDRKSYFSRARQEKLLYRKNESIEMSPAEIRAKQAIENAIDALNEAEKACRTIDLDDMWSSNNWAKLGRDCEAALSYLPRPGDF